MICEKKGFVIWVTGLSGSGKSTFSNLIVNYIQKEYSTKILHLDGDVLREIFSNKNYSIDERKKISFQYSNLCKFLTIQNLNIVISTISMFNEVRKWNKKNIYNYFEIYINSSLNTLIKRDKNNLYSKALKGEIKNVIGIDADYDEPRNPDIQVLNNSNKSINDVYNEIINNIDLDSFLKNQFKV